MFRSDVRGRSRPIMHEIEATRCGVIRDRKTLAAIPPDEICREYNALLAIVQHVAVLGRAERDAVEQAQALLMDGPVVDSKRTTASGGPGDE